jgi:hypothetical protein
MANAVPHFPFLELIEINRVGQIPERLLSQLRVSTVTQRVDHTSLAVLHLYHRALASAARRRGAAARRDGRPGSVSLPLDYPRRTPSTSAAVSR